MSKESLDRSNGEGDMPPHTLTREVVEDMKSRGIIIRDYNLEHPPPNSGPPPGWNQGPSGYYPPDNRYQAPPPENWNSSSGLKRSRENWGDNSAPPHKRPYN